MIFSVEYKKKIFIKTRTRCLEIFAIVFSGLQIKTRKKI